MWVRPLTAEGGGAPSCRPPHLFEPPLAIACLYSVKHRRWQGSGRMLCRQIAACTDSAQDVNVIDNYYYCILRIIGTCKADI